MLALGLLLALFRQSERWLHQRLFKLGWLLTQSFQLTTALYYLLFTPGIALRELSRWACAAVLRLRAERTIQFPERGEILTLELSFVRLAPGASKAKTAIVDLAPLVLGTLALWLAADRVFQWEALLALAAPMTLDALGQAWAALLSTPDFWLWFYFAFAIANTMLPHSASQQGRRRKAASWAAGLGALYIVWLGSGAIDASIALFIESLAGGIVLVLLQVAAFNLLAVIALGALEAIVERLSGKSASFRDGRLVAQSRDEAQAEKAGQLQNGRTAINERATRQAARQLKSIYDLPLPIPGPPGREPVSRSAVTVVGAPAPQSNKPDPAPRQSATLETPAAPTPDLEASPPDEITESWLPGEAAPFARPFAGDAQAKAPESRLQEPDEAESTPFPRPFAMKSRPPQEGDGQPLNDEADPN